MNDPEGDPDEPAWFAPLRYVEILIVLAVPTALAAWIVWHLMFASAPDPRNGALLNDRDEPISLEALDRAAERFPARSRRLHELWVPETLAGDFRKFWPVPVMVALGRV